MFKQILILSCLVLLGSSLIFATNFKSATQNRAVETAQGKSISPVRNPPAYTFTRTPYSIMTSYYDYMIGSYNGLPLQRIPDAQGGGYFLTYHGRRTPTGTRRVFYAHIDNNGTLINNNEITSVTNNEGYPTVAVDPVSGKPLYAWHCNADADAEFEVQFTSDAFISGLSGLFNDTQIIANGPITITPGVGTPTTDNEFLWPTAQIGPSPIAGKRRVYVIMRNSISHSYGPSENVYIAYADFNGSMLENSTPLVWSTTTIPEMNQWNHNATWRRPFHAVTADQMGNLYYAGYHFATEADGATDILEADFDVFKCPNYGQGTWTRISQWSNIPSWNPPVSPTSTTGYFADDNDVPYTNLSFHISNSSHLNAVTDGNGRIIVPGIWALSTGEGTYYPAMQFIKAMVYNPATNTFAVKEIYPQKDPNDTFNQCYTPWDTEAPFGVVDEYGGDAATGYYPLMATAWPFPHWNDTLHTDAMMFHYNNIKVSEVNDEGMMVAVWQDSERARSFNKYSDTDYTAYANTPEILISVSSNSGDNWSEPIILNNVQTPQFSGLKPMWVYPANKVKYINTVNGQKIGKIGLMFYNDYTWGANAITPAAHPTNDGGQVMFTELQITFPASAPNPTDPFGEPLVLSGSMSMMAGVMIDQQMASSGDVLAAFVDVAGNPQLRGKGIIQMVNGNAGSLLQIFTESNGEQVYFKIWDSSTNSVFNIIETVLSQVNGTIGSYPNDLYWLHANIPMQQSISLSAGWNMISFNVHPQNTDISSVFASIMNNVLMIKSPDGIYVPGNPYNSLTSISDGKAYYVKVGQSCSLNLTGSPLSPNTPIPLNTGWNLVAYTRATAMNIVAALASISGQIIQVKGSEGIYEPGNPYSTLTTLSPNRGYWMKLNSVASLIYPSTGRAESPQVMKTTNPAIGTLRLQSNSQSVLVEINGTVADGSIVAAYVDGELRGYSDIKEIDGKAGALIQIFSEFTNEKVDFKLFTADSELSKGIYPGLLTLPGSIIGDYAAGVYYQLSYNAEEVPQLPITAISAYPNPFSSNTKILLNLAKEDASLHLDIFNVRGQKVRTLHSGQLNAGSHQILWDAQDDSGRMVSSGLYFCRLHSLNGNRNLKLMILK